MAIILDGKSLSQKIKEDVKTAVTEWCAHGGEKPGLATLLVGEDAASQVYIRNKIRSTKACGMISFHQQMPADVSEEQVLQQVHAWNQDPKVHGILVQLPLPKHISEEKILLAIDPAKDVDGFHPINVGKLVAGQDGLKPCTPFGVMRLLEEYNVSLPGKEAVVIGRSQIVGKPMALLLLNASATVTIAHSATKDLKAHLERADIVISAVGKPKMIKADWLKQGAVVVDVGINRLESGKLCGDVDFELAKEKASHITPVPGGVGPMTIAMLMVNTFTAMKRKNA